MMSVVAIEEFEDALEETEELEGVEELDELLEGVDELELLELLCVFDVLSCEEELGVLEVVSKEVTEELVLSDVDGVEVISVILLEQPLTKDVNNTIGKNNFLNFMI